MMNDLLQDSFGTDVLGVLELQGVTTIFQPMRRRSDTGGLLQLLENVWSSTGVAGSTGAADAAGAADAVERVKYHGMVGDGRGEEEETYFCRDCYGYCF